MPEVINSIVKVNPNPNDVFMTDPDGHYRNLMPFAVFPAEFFIIKCDRSFLWPIPYEPHDGVIGATNVKKYTTKGSLSCKGWLAFDWVENKIKLDVPLTYFYFEYERMKGVNENDIYEIGALNKKRNGFREFCAEYSSGNVKLLDTPDSVNPGIKNMGVFSHRGKKAYDGNWTVGWGLKVDPVKMLPITSDGSKWNYLGTLQCLGGKFLYDPILGFVNEKHNKLLFTVEYG